MTGPARQARPGIFGDFVGTLDARRTTGHARQARGRRPGAFPRMKGGRRFDPHGAASLPALEVLTYFRRDKTALKVPGRRRHPQTAR